MFGREDIEFGNSARRPKSPSYDALVDHKSIAGENEIRIFAGKSLESREIDSSIKINRLSGELLSKNHSRDE